MYASWSISIRWRRGELISELYREPDLDTSMSDTTTKWHNKHNKWQNNTEGRSRPIWTPPCCYFLQSSSHGTTILLNTRKMNLNQWISNPCTAADRYTTAHLFQILLKTMGVSTRIDLSQLAATKPKCSLSLAASGLKSSTCVKTTVDGQLAHAFCACERK